MEDYYTTSYYGYSDAIAIKQNFIAVTAIFTGIIMIISIVLSILMIVSMWKIYVKAGKPGWASLVPIYNIYVMCEIAEREWWYILLLCIPFVQIYAMYVVYDGIAKKFGKSNGFAIGMIFLPFIFFMILGFGKSSIYMDSNEVSLDDNISSVNTVDEKKEESLDNNISSVNTVDEKKEDYSQIESTNTVNNAVTSNSGTNIADGYVAPFFEESVTQQSNDQNVNVNQNTNQASEVIDKPVFQTMEQATMMSKPIQPMMEQTPMENDTVGKTIEQALSESDPFTAVKEVPQQPTIQKEVSTSENTMNTSSWSNNNTDNGQM